MTVDRVRAFVLRSSRHETTFAIVSCQRTKSVQRPHELYPAVVRAVTAWVRETDEGRQAYRGSCADYNVGDLSKDLESASLERFLNRAGVLGLQIEIISDTHVQDNWTYDSHLVGEEPDEEAAQ